MIDWRETYSFESPCVFLDTANGNACKIHDAKPVSCREFKCWEEPKGWVPFLEDALKDLGWDGVSPDEDQYDDE